MDKPVRMGSIWRTHWKLCEGARLYSMNEVVRLL